MLRPHRPRRAGLHRRLRQRQAPAVGRELERRRDSALNLPVFHAGRGLHAAKCVAGPVALHCGFFMLSRSPLQAAGRCLREIVAHVLQFASALRCRASSPLPAGRRPGAAGCAMPTDKPLVYSQEKFDSVSRHARSFGVSAAQTCEAARRALLSHGYLVQRSNAELVDGRKSFQPSVDTHVEIEFHVVCAPEGPDRSTVFVNALQDRYALKKTSNSASLGVGPVGSVSLPFGSSSRLAGEDRQRDDPVRRLLRPLLRPDRAPARPDRGRPAEDPAEAVLPRSRRTRSSSQSRAPAAVRSPSAAERTPGRRPAAGRGVEPGETGAVARREVAAQPAAYLGTLVAA